MHDLIPINIIGGAYKGRSRNNIQELINMFVHIDNHGGESVLELRGTPGLTLWYDFGALEEVRGFDIVAGELWVVVGNTLYSVTGSSGSGGIKTSKGTLATSSGPVQIKNNGADVAVCDGVNVYSQSGVTLTAERTASFLAYQDGWFIIIVPNSGSALATTDPAAWGGAPSIAAEGNPDFIVSAISDHRELVLLNADSIEILYNSGSAVLPFVRTSGGFIEVGCGAKNSVVKMNNQVYFLDNNNQIRRLTGLQTEIVSTPEISYQISLLSDTQEAIAYSYSIEGHFIYVLTFDEANITYCFDSATNLWYKWSTGGYSNRHISNCFIRYSNKNLVGGYANGKIYVIEPDTKTDDSTAIYRERTTQYITNKPSDTFFNKLILEIETATVPGTEPYIMLDWSDDFGKTYSTIRQESLGAAGQYNRPVEFCALGSARHRAFRIRITDNAFVAIQNAELIGGVGWY
jgi:hypothetical protein